MDRQTRTRLFAVSVMLGLMVGCGDDSDSPSGAGSGGSVAGSSAGSSGSSAGAGGAAAAANCSTYCALAVGGMCTGALQVYPDAAACQTGCAMITTPGSVTDTSGNTLGCRIYHLTVAQMNATNAMTHCLHGKVMSDTCK